MGPIVGVVVGSLAAWTLASAPLAVLAARALRRTTDLADEREALRHLEAAAA